jgi:hypothetical protein
MQTSLVNRGVYFYCAPYERPEKAAYQHQAICIAEGLRSIGFKIFSNVNYWNPDGHYLFVHDPAVQPADCDVVLIGDAWFDAGRPMPDVFTRTRRLYRTVYLDSQDGSKLFSHGRLWHSFDFILRSHFVDDASNGANFHPWPFGLSQRMIDATSALSYDDRHGVLLNYRHTRYPHSVRIAVSRTVVPKLAEHFSIETNTKAVSSEPSQDERSLWEQTGRRHSLEYFRRLLSAQACLAFGGYFIFAFPKESDSFLSRFGKAAIRRAGFTTHRIVQWDSWRLWEAMAAGAAALHVDFDMYACRLPVAPTNWQHYIGFDLSRPSLTIERILAGDAELETVGRAGREWALQHYSPAATAKRFCELLGLGQWTD